MGQRCGVRGTIGCRVVDRGGVRGRSGYVVIIDVAVDDKGCVAAGRGRYRHG
jgi:hypothetical protein